MDIGEYVADVRSGTKHRITAVHEQADYPSLLNFNMMSLDGLWLSEGTEGRFLVRCVVEENELLPALTLGQHVSFNHQRYEVSEAAADRSYWLQRLNAETLEEQEMTFALREELWVYPTSPSTK